MSRARYVAGAALVGAGACVLIGGLCVGVLLVMAGTRVDARAGALLY